jgi:hypothetical protein
MNKIWDALALMKAEGRTVASLRNELGYCPVGALAKQIDPNSIDEKLAWNEVHEDEAYQLVEESPEGQFLANYLLDHGYILESNFHNEYGWSGSDEVIFEWNDATLEEDVFAVMEAAASAYDEEISTSASLQSSWT